MVYEKLRHLELTSCGKLDRALQGTEALRTNGSLVYSVVPTAPTRGMALYNLPSEMEARQERNCDEDRVLFIFSRPP